MTLIVASLNFVILVYTVPAETREKTPDEFLRLRDFSTNLAEDMRYAGTRQFHRSASQRHEAQSAGCPVAGLALPVANPVLTGSKCHVDR
jgi:hypothetical protein